jgi:hypothetical protein
MPPLILVLLGAPISLELGGSSQLEVSVIGQLRLTESDRPGGASEVQVNLQRLRETLRLYTFDRRFAFGLSVNTTPAVQELIELSIEGRPTPWLRLKGGFFKVPFTAYRAQSYAELSFVDWATLVTRPFGAEHQLGLELHAAVESWTLVFGTFGGAPVRAAHGLGLAPSFGLPTRNLANLNDLGLPGRLHPELFTRVSFRSAAAGLELIASAAIDLSPEEQRDLAFRAAPEVRWRGGPAEAFGVFYVGGPSSAPTQLKGGLVEAHLDVDDGLRLSARWSALAREPELVDASRAPKFEEERTFAMMFRVLGAQLELIADLAQLRQVRALGVVEEWRARAQVQGGW